MRLQVSRRWGQGQVPVSNSQRNLKLRAAASVVSFAIILFVAASSGLAERLVLENDSRSLVVCTIISKRASLPLAQLLIYPDQQVNWTPPNSHHDEYKVSFLADDQGSRPQERPLFVTLSRLDKVVRLHKSGHDYRLDVSDAVDR